LVVVQQGPFPTFARAKLVELDALAWMVSFADSRFFDMLHIPELISLHLCLWLASRILALLLCLLEPLCLCVHRRIHYGSPWEVQDLFLEVIHLNHGSVTPDL
jgi:hypothetical protein